jgi:hypothetical protein
MIPRRFFGLPGGGRNSSALKQSITSVALPLA